MKIGANIKQCERRSSAAFTMAEVIMAVGLFGIAFLAAYSGLTQGCKITQATRENERATQILLDKAEILRLYTWDELTNIAFTPLAFTNYYNPSGANGNQGPAYYGTVTITNAPITETYSTDMMLLTFQLTWANENTSHQRQLTTLVSRYGMHNYIFGPTN